MIQQPSRSKRARHETKQRSSKTRCNEVALFLNNIGIQFLLQDCYSQAVVTFQDAYFLIKRSLLSHNVSTNDLQVIMGRAFYNITNPRPEESSQLVLEVLEIGKDDDKLLVRNANCGHVLQHILETAPSSFVAFPIQLQEQPISFLRQQVAIVEHNVAIAHFCRSKVSSSPSSLQEALRFFETAAFTFLSMRQTSYSDTRFLSLTIAILNSFLHVLQETERKEEILQCYEILGQCRDAACDTIERLEHLHDPR